MYVIFCANVCFVYGGGGKGYWQTKHEVEKIWFWWRMSGQLEMCAFSSVSTILRSFLLFSRLHFSGPQTRFDLFNYSPREQTHGLYNSV